jgi:hypothetical protein
MCSADVDSESPPLGGHLGNGVPAGVRGQCQCCQATGHWTYHSKEAVSMGPLSTFRPKGEAIRVTGLREESCTEY